MSGHESSLLRRLERFWFSSADARVYDLFRIAFGLASVINWLYIWPQRHMLFSDRGLLDTETLGTLPDHALHLSVLKWLDSPAAVTAVMVVAGIGLIGLITGTFTRSSTLIVYVWHLSYTRRLMMMLAGWDRIFVIYAFLLLISPIGRTWSVDAALRGKNRGGGGGGGGIIQVPSYGLKLMQLQLIVIYLDTVWLKLPDEFWQSGELIAYFLMSYYSRVAHPIWADLEWLSVVLTYSTLVIETAIPFLLLFRKTRPLAFALGLGLHGTIAILSNLYLFSVAILPLYLCFLEGKDIEAIRNALKRWFLGASEEKKMEREVREEPVEPAEAVGLSEAKR